MWQMQSLLYVAYIHVPTYVTCISFPHSANVSVQVAVEMPFDIKTIESPTHKVKIKVSG